MSLQDDDLCLSAASIAALSEFLKEQNDRQLKLSAEDQEITDISVFSEDWQLSQFWYDDETSDALATEILSETLPEQRIACISCPSTFLALKRSPLFNTRNIILFEFDKRFAAFKSHYEYYDFNHPFQLSDGLEASFDFISVDPPFLSDECWTKTASTVKFLGKSDSKILCCTGLIMKQKLQSELNCSLTNFHPKHKGGLANEFRSFVNYKSNQLFK